jgi:hypothetical protein
VRLGDLALLQPARDARVQKHKVGLKLRDETAIERRRHHLVDRKQEAEITKLAQPSKPGIIDIWLGLTLHQPGELTGIHPVALREGRKIEILSRERLAGQGDQEHGGTRVLRERERCADREHWRESGRAWQRFIPQVDAVDQVDDGLQRNTRSCRSRGTVGCGAAHNCGFQAVPHIGFLIGTVPRSSTSHLRTERPTNRCRSPVRIHVRC